MYRNRIVITSLHEDLMNIGLLPKNKKFLNEMVDEEEDDNAKRDDDQEDENPDKDMDNQDDQDQSDDDQEDMDDDHKSEKHFSHEKMGEMEEEGEPGADPSQGAPGQPEDIDSEIAQLEQLLAQLQAKKAEQEGGASGETPQPAPSANPMSAAPSPSPMSNESRNNSSMKKVNTLLEEVQNLVKHSDGIQRRETMKSFAEMSMNSEMLSRGFVRLAKTLDEQDLRAVAHTFRNLSESTGKTALALKSNRNVKNVEESFKKAMNKLLEGLALYQDIIEACADMGHEEDPSHDHDDEKDGDINVHVDKVGKDHNVDDDDEKDEENLY